jgi:hypothetical protein
MIIQYLTSYNIPTIPRYMQSRKQSTQTDNIDQAQQYRYLLRRYKIDRSQYRLKA